MHPAELDQGKLAIFLRRVEDGYNDTPYHSKSHAADVLQSMHTLLTLGGLASRMNDELVMLAGKSCNLSALPMFTLGHLASHMNSELVMLAGKLLLHALLPSNG